MTEMLLNRRVLLTGGAGFIGSHLAQALIKDGVHLTIVDNLDDFYCRSWKLANLEAIRVVGAYGFSHLDICDFDRLEGVFAHAKPEIVIHLAARAGVRPSIEQPRLCEQVNIAGTFNVLELCRKFQTCRFVFGSSSSVYGASSQAPFSENQLELRPISPYAATKMAGETAAYTYAHLFGLAVICLRFFTVYGARQRPDLAIHKFTALIEAGLPVPIFGDGSTGRDYTHVDDIVKGILASLSYRFEGTEPKFEVFNLGNSHPVTLSELVSLLERATGRNALRQQRPVQLGDVPLTWANISKAESLLGYKPKMTLKDGLNEFVKWYRATGAGSKLAFNMAQVSTLRQGASH